MLFYFYSPQSILGDILFLPCPFVVLFVGLFATTLTFAITFVILKIISNFMFGMHLYLMELHILSGERSR
jgi:hypothetical protein